MNNGNTSGVNYIKLVNWAWQEIPYIRGCRASHIALFFAVVDSINRNKWGPTSIEYDALVKKCRLSKETYLAARGWLMKENLIQFEPGRHKYQSAIFRLGTAVGNQTSRREIQGKSYR